MNKFSVSYFKLNQVHLLFNNIFVIIAVFGNGQICIVLKCDRRRKNIRCMYTNCILWKKEKVYRIKTKMCIGFMRSAHENFDIPFTIFDTFLN